jgi:hypothetical protein
MAMINSKTSLLLLLLLMAKAEAFAHCRLAFHRMNAVLREDKQSVNDESIARTTHDFEELVKEFRDVKEDYVTDEERIRLTEVILEKAADMTAFQKYKQEEILSEVTDELVHAHGDVERAEEEKRRVHQDAAASEHEASLLESVDADYEDQERVRDLSVAHAAHHLEDDLQDLSVDAQFHELEAEIKQEEAEELLHQLEQQERDLKVTMKEIKNYKKEKNVEKWKMRLDELHYAQYQQQLEDLEALLLEDLKFDGGNIYESSLLLVDERSLLPQGMELVRAAVEEDNAGQYVDALALYRNAINRFKKGLHYEKNAARREFILDHIKGFIARAEELANYVKNQ